MVRVGVDVVVWLVVVGEAVVVTDWIGWVFDVLSLSPATMIKPTTRPITRATRMPIVQRARVFTGAMLAEDAAGTWPHDAPWNPSASGPAWL